MGQSADLKYDKAYEGYVRVCAICGMPLKQPYSGLESIKAKITGQWIYFDDENLHIVDNTVLVFCKECTIKIYKNLIQTQLEAINKRFSLDLGGG